MERARPTRTPRPSGASSAGPPVLGLELKRKLLVLLLANSLPLLAMGIVAVGVAQGRMTLKPGSDRVLLPIVMVLAACAVLAASCWIILPVGRWLRNWTCWHFRHGNRILWALPYLAGWCTWLAFCLFGLAAALGALALLVLCLVDLARVWPG